MWFTSHDSKHQSPVFVPSLSLWMELGNWLCSVRKLTIISALLSTMMFLRLRSHARRTPSSTAFAFVSKALRGKSILLLIAPIDCPLLFLMTIPTPQHLISLNTALSTLIFLIPPPGGSPWGIDWLGGGGEGEATTDLFHLSNFSNICSHHPYYHISTFTLPTMTHCISIIPQTPCRDSK